MGFFVICIWGFIFIYCNWVQEGFPLAAQAALCVAACLWSISSSQRESVSRVTFIYPVAKCCSTFKIKPRLVFQTVLLAEALESCNPSPERTVHSKRQ